MKIDINDPRITAFALGELTGSDAIELARAVRSDSNIRAAVEEARETAALLHGTIGRGEVHLLTSEQREAVRSAGGGVTISEISSARVPFWRHPAAVSMGAAAAVALGVFIAQQRGGDTPQITDNKPSWDWSKVGMEDLTSPVMMDEVNDVALSNTMDESATAVAAAMSDDTASFRKEIKNRINKKDIKTLPKLPELKERDWESLEGKDRITVNVPLTSGATSWPLLQRYIGEMSTLPPSSAVRIEEMVNHFGYKTPTMLKGGGLVGDMEICDTPWNPTTVLLAIHMRAISEETSDAVAAVTLNGQQVKRARILGYSGVMPGSAKPNSMHISKTHGNYVIYELELNGNRDGDQTIATLQIGQQEANLQVSSGKVKSWFTTSEDLRFASTVTAAGMLLSSTKELGELDADRLLSLLGVLEQKDSSSLLGERKLALPILKRSAELLNESFEMGH